MGCIVRLLLPTLKAIVRPVHDMKYPQLPLFLIFGNSDYHETMDKLDLIVNMDFAPVISNHWPCLPVFTTHQRAVNFMERSGVSGKSVRCSAFRLRDVLSHLLPKAILVNPEMDQSFETRIQTDECFDWIYSELAKTADRLPFPFFAPTDAIADDFKPLALIDDKDKSRDFWPLFRDERLAKHFASKNADRQRECYRFASAADMLENMREDFTETVDEVWIAGLLSDRRTLYWAEKMPLSRFMERVRSQASEDIAR